MTTLLRALLVEVDEDTLTLLTHILQDDACRVSVVRDGSDLLAASNARQANLVSSAMKLPGRRTAGRTTIRVKSIIPGRGADLAWKHHRPEELVAKLEQGEALREEEKSAVATVRSIEPMGQPQQLPAKQVQAPEACSRRAPKGVGERSAGQSGS